MGGYSHWLTSLTSVAASATIVAMEPRRDV